MANSTSPHENLEGKEAIEKIKSICERARVCMFTTQVNSETPNSTPMSLQEVDTEGNLWFISSTESTRNHDIESHNKVQLYFMNTEKYEYVYLNAKAAIYTDKETIDKYYNIIANAWFDGKDDPKVSIIKVTPSEAYYYETSNGKLVSFAKMIIAATTGIKLNDGGIEGKITI